MPEQTAAAFDEWAVLELFGHRKLAGRVREATLAGGAFLRLDIPGAEDGDPMATQFYSPSAVYAITPVTEELARQVATRFRPEPVTRWELPALASAVQRTVDHEPDPDDEEVDDVDREVLFYEPAELTPEAVGNALDLADDHVDQAAIEHWTELERLMAYDYALRVHLRASDNDDVEARPRPSFIVLAAVS